MYIVIYFKLYFIPVLAKLNFSTVSAPVSVLHDMMSHHDLFFKKSFVLIMLKIVLLLNVFFVETVMLFSGSFDA